MPTRELPEKSEITIIGGGIVGGVTIAHELAKRGARKSLS